MKTIKREILKVGQFGQLGGKKVAITPDIIKDVRETFDGKCPCTIGHQLADFMPKFGNVASLEPESSDVSLVAKMDLNDLLADAIDEGFYSDTSVGIARNLQGKYYLHHNAFLGAVPPKIRDLKVFSDLDIVCLADGPAIELATPEERAQAAQRIMEAKRRATFGIEDAARSVSELAAWATEMAMSGGLATDLKDVIGQLADMLSDHTGTKPKPKEGKKVELKEENEKLRKDLADANGRLATTAKAGLSKAMEGKIPKAKQADVLALADHLSAIEPIELSDESGEKKTSSPLDILKAVFESIPKPALDSRADLGDAGVEGHLDLSKIKGKF